MESGHSARRMCYASSTQRVARPLPARVTCRTDALERRPCVKCGRCRRRGRCVGRPTAIAMRTIYAMASPTNVQMVADLRGQFVDSPAECVTQARFVTARTRNARRMFASPQARSAEPVPVRVT